MPPYFALPQSFKLCCFLKELLSNHKALYKRYDFFLLLFGVIPKSNIHCGALNLHVNRSG